MGPRRPLEGLKPRARACSCVPVLPAADTCTPRMMKDEEGGAGARRCRCEVYFCLFLAWGLGQILHLMTLTFPFCQMRKQLQTLQGLVPGVTEGQPRAHCFCWVGCRRPLCLSWANNAGGPRGCRPEPPEPDTAVSSLCCQEGAAISRGALLGG